MPRSASVRGDMNMAPVTLDDSTALHSHSSDEDTPAPSLRGTLALHPPAGSFESSKDSEDDPSDFPVTVVLALAI